MTLQILKNAAHHHGLSALFPSSTEPHHQLVIQPLRSIPSTSYQSNPDLFHSKQQFDNFNHNIPQTQPLVFREDIPSDEIKSLNHTPSVKTLPKPPINKNFVIK